MVLNTRGLCPPRLQHHHHFSADMTEIELPFQSLCLSGGDRDPEEELEDGWSTGGDGTAAGWGGWGGCGSPSVLLFVK